MEQQANYDCNGAKWFCCLECGTKLAPVSIHKGRTVIVLGVLALAAYLDRAEIRCPACGAWRKFASVPVVDAEFLKREV